MYKYDSIQRSIDNINTTINESKISVADAIIGSCNHNITITEYCDHVSNEESFMMLEATGIKRNKGVSFIIEKIMALLEKIKSMISNVLYSLKQSEPSFDDDGLAIVSENYNEFCGIISGDLNNILVKLVDFISDINNNERVHDRNTVKELSDLADECIGLISKVDDIIIDDLQSFKKGVTTGVEYINYKKFNKTNNNVINKFIRSCTKQIASMNKLKDKVDYQTKEGADEIVFFKAVSIEFSNVVGMLEIMINKLADYFEEIQK